MTNRNRMQHAGRERGTGAACKSTSTTQVRCHEGRAIGWQAGILKSDHAVVAVFPHHHHHHHHHDHLQQHQHRRRHHHQHEHPPSSSSSSSHHHHQQQQYPKSIAISIIVFIIIASSTSTSTMSDISALWPSFFARVSSIVIVRDGGHAALISITAFCAATCCDKTLVIAASSPGRQPPKSGTRSRLYTLKPVLPLPQNR